MKPVWKPATLSDKWERSCLGKIGYVTRLEALREALILEAKDKRKMNVYHCQCCSKWHVGGLR